jgi:adenosylhomocysteine nucleosidase
MDRHKIGFIVGMKAEARLLRKTGFMVGVGGGMPEGAAHAAERLIAQGATYLISFGLAGGLNPAMPPGTVLVPSVVMEGEVIYSCDPQLVVFLGGVTITAIFAGTEIAVTAAQKSGLFAATKADAVDLESGAVARTACAHNLPFAVLRAVADPAWRDLPPAASIALNAAGKISLLPILASVRRNPGQIPALLALARDAKAANAALKKALAAR